MRDRGTSELFNVRQTLEHSLHIIENTTAKGVYILGGDPQGTSELRITEFLLRHQKNDELFFYIYIYIPTKAWKVHFEVYNTIIVFFFFLI